MIEMIETDRAELAMRPWRSLAHRLATILGELTGLS
jgi:hypothetical protein